jgi:hypothetical protein
MKETVAQQVEGLSETVESLPGAEQAAEGLREDAAFIRAVRPAGARTAVKPLLPFLITVGMALLLERLPRSGAASSPAERLRAEGARVGHRIAERAWTVGRDTRSVRRKQRLWNLLQASTAAGFTLLARRAADGAWEALTGHESPQRTQPTGVRRVD